MIIFVVDIVGIFPDEGKGHSPIPTGADSPRSLPIALKLMKVQAGQAHIFRSSGGVELAEDQS
jgi:hypothetical protein